MPSTYWCARVSHGLFSLLRPDIRTLGLRTFLDIFCLFFEDIWVPERCRNALIPWYGHHLLLLSSSPKEMLLNERTPIIIPFNSSTWSKWCFKHSIQPTIFLKQSEEGSKIPLSPSDLMARNLHKRFPGWHAYDPASTSNSDSSQLIPSERLKHFRRERGGGKLMTSFWNANPQC